MYPEGEPLRTAMCGIDGAGKSTTLALVVEQFSRERYRIVQIGRRPFSIVDGEKRYHYPWIALFVDNLHKAADRIGSYRGVLLANAVNVILQGKFVEPSLVARYNPDLIVGERDFIVDSGVYALVYSPFLSQFSVDERIRRIKKMSGLKYRDIQLFLTVDPSEADARIVQRMIQESGDIDPSSRLKWRHLHENPKTLNILQQEYQPAFDYLNTQSSHTLIYGINTTDLPQTEVATIITEILHQNLAIKRTSNPSMSPSLSNFAYQPHTDR